MFGRSPDGTLAVMSLGRVTWSTRSRPGLPSPSRSGWTTRSGRGRRRTRPPPLRLPTSSIGCVTERCWLHGGAGTEQLEVAARTFHPVWLGREELGTNPIGHPHDCLPVFLETFRWFVDRDSLARLQVVVRERQRFEAEHLTRGERVDTQLKVALQLGGSPGRTGLVIDDLIHPVGVAVHPIDAAAET